MLGVLTKSKQLQNINFICFELNSADALTKLKIASILNRLLDKVAFIHLHLQWGEREIYIGFDLNGQKR